MTPGEARERLGFHSGRDSRIDDPRWKAGFLSSLRPYSGKLNRDAMDDVIACVEAVTDDLGADTLPRDLINDLWGIVHLGRVWALMEGGMLQSNKLIDPSDARTLDLWLTDLSYAVLSLLDGNADSALAALNDAKSRV